MLKGRIGERSKKVRKKQMHLFFGESFAKFFEKKASRLEKQKRQNAVMPLTKLQQVRFLKKQAAVMSRKALNALSNPQISGSFDLAFYSNCIPVLERYLKDFNAEKQNVTLARARFAMRIAQKILRFE